MRYSEQADGAFEIASGEESLSFAFVTNAIGRQSRDARDEGVRL